MAQEVELKLVLAAEDADTLAANLFAEDAAKPAKMHAIYFDTPDHDLAVQGASLRIRRTGRKRIQTVKVNGAKGAGLFARPEWEQPVADDQPVLDDTTPIAALLGGAVDRLAPVFVVVTERRTLMIEDADAEIELVLDRGAVSMGDRRSVVCEVELELKRGDPAALFGLARRIAGIVPMRLGVLTKSERGYNLLAAAPMAFKAEPLALRADLSTVDALQAIMRACLRQYRLNETILLERRAPEALHQARVALRRLRSALGIFRRVLGKRDSARFRADLGWLAQVLGHARDLDVLVAAAADKPGPGVVFDALEVARDDAYAAVGETLASPRALTMMLDLAEWLATGDWATAAQTQALREMPARQFAADALRRRRKAIKTGGKSLKTLRDAQRHEVRKAAKTLRYSAEFFAGLFGGNAARRRHAKFLAALETLQDRLGALNDRATAPALLRSLGLMDSEGASALLDHRKRGKQIRAAAGAHEALLDRKPFWR